MSPEYPYQLVCFLDKYPEIAEGVYQGENGWYPQLTLKRRFQVDEMSEDGVIDSIARFAETQHEFVVNTGKLVQPERMPVRVIEIRNQANLLRLHQDFIRHMGARMLSRYPERDGDNYLPHITAEYGGGFVLDVDAYAQKSFTISRICLIKDQEDTDSHVVQYFDMKAN